MKLLKSVLRNEGLLLLRNKFLTIPLLVNILLWGYVIISYEIQTIHYEERAAVFYRSFIWLMLLNLLIVGLFAVYMASKDRENKFEQLVVTYEVKNMEWIMGKWLVAQLYGLSITAITVFVQAIWFLRAAMTMEEWFQNIIYVFIQMEGAFFILISIGFFAAHLIKNMFAYLAIPVLLILSLLLPFDNVGTALTYQNPRIHLLTPFDYMFIGTPYESMWGIGRVFNSTILHQGGVFLFGIIVLFLALLLFQRKRLTIKEKKIVPILIAVFLVPVIILSGMRYMEYDQALRKFIETGKLYASSYNEKGQESFEEWWNSFYNPHFDDRPYEFSMEKASLEIELQHNNQLHVESTLKIKNNGDVPTKDVYLTLYHGLYIEECLSPREMTFSREKDFIKLRFEKALEPSEEVEITLNYGGDILQFRDDAYVEQAFIEKKRVYLPKEAGWYPLIGKRPLVIAREHEERYVKFELRNARLLEDYPTDFTVEIKNKGSKIPLALTIPEISEGLFQGHTQYGLSLLGGNLKEIAVEGIRVIAHPEVITGAKELVEKYEIAWEFIENWLGISMKPSTIYVLSDWHDYHAKETHSYDYFTISSNDLEFLDDDEIAYQLVDDLDDKDRQGEGFRYLSSAMEWIIVNELNESAGFKEWYVSMWGTDGEDLTLINLLDNYQKRGELKEVVRFLYNYANQLGEDQELDIKEALQQYEGESGK